MYQIYFIFGMTPYMFRTVLPSIIRSSRLMMIMCQTDTAVCLASRQQYLFDICLLLYVQSWTPDDGWQDLPKHVVLFQNKIIWYIDASGWFYYRNILRCAALWTSNQTLEVTVTPVTSRITCLWVWHLLGNYFVYFRLPKPCVKGTKNS